MTEEYNFDEIRPYNDSELREGMIRATESPDVRSVLKFLYPDKDIDEYIKYLLSIKTVYQFQKDVIATFLRDFLTKTGNNFDINGLYNIENKKVLFISNHRDIVLDAALLDTLLLENGYDTAANAIGDNLIAKPWIAEMMKLNKNFIVKRSGTKREIFDASKRLSAYIRMNIVEGLNSIWIAQREGRAKNADDRTQESVLKMFSMSGDKSMKQSFMELNITPVSISYEYDACDFLKAKEFQQKRDDPEFKKSVADDVLNMKTGFQGRKGLIHYEVCKTINEEIDKELTEEDNRAVAVSKIAQIIDKSIHSNYRVFPHNYVALDEIEGTTKYSGEKYDQVQKEKFDEYISGQIAKIDLANKDVDFLRTKLLEMYSNPLRNKLQTL